MGRGVICPFSHLSYKTPYLPPFLSLFLSTIPNLDTHTTHFLTIEYPPFFSSTSTEQTSHLHDHENLSSTRPREKKPIKPCKVVSVASTLNGHAVPAESNNIFFMSLG